MDEPVYIVGGGPSLVNFDMAKLTDVSTIGVNKSAFFIPNVNYFITMDYTFIRKIGYARLKALNGARFFVANLSINYLNPVRGAITDTRSNFVYDQLYDVFDTIIICRQENGIGLSFRDFRCGNNSGYCALQLAIVLGYTQIYLLGVDLHIERTRTHFHSGYRDRPVEFQKRIKSYTASFVNALQELKQKRPNITVISCSERSPLNKILPYIPLNEVPYK